MKKTVRIILAAAVLCAAQITVSYAMVNAACGPESAVRTTAGPGSVQTSSNTGSVQTGLEASRQNPAAAQTVTGPTGPGGATGPGSAAQLSQGTETAQPEAQTQETAQVSNGRGIDPSKPMIALTYDDGPQTTSGNRIMDTFLKYNQRCTFFLVGDRIPSRAEEVKRMADNGFEIGNHSYSHAYLNKCDAATVRSEIAKCNEMIEKYAGVTPRVMRLPGGNKNETVLSNVNMPIILWNVDTRDWDHRNAQKTIDAVIGKVKDGDVVLMHELYSATADATEYIVPRLVEQGFQLVTVSELVQYRGISLAPNQVYYSFRP